MLYFEHNVNTFTSPAAHGLISGSVTKTITDKLNAYKGKTTQFVDQNFISKLTHCFLHDIYSVLCLYYADITRTNYK